MVTTDIVTDRGEGVHGWHLGVEAAIALAALFGTLLLLRGSFTLRKSLAEEKENSSQLRAEAEQWRLQSRKYLEGLSQAIDRQLSEWKLTASEKEIAFLLLKGLSLKEIAEVRSTAEKTARTQSMSIYAKAGLAGRSELSAYFLEDLLVPSTEPGASQGAAHSPSR
jgi:DNA-binding CsgD family transcriptional regulator